TLFPGLWLTEITPDLYKGKVTIMTCNYCCCFRWFEVVPDGLQKVFNYDAKVDMRRCRRHNFVLKDEVSFQAKPEKTKKEYEKTITSYYKKQMKKAEVGLGSDDLLSEFDFGAKSSSSNGLITMVPGTTKANYGASGVDDYLDSMFSTGTQSNTRPSQSSTSEVAGANNNLTVLNHSLLFDDLLDDIPPVVSYKVNGVTFEKGYYLADTHNVYLLSNHLRLHETRKIPYLNVDKKVLEKTLKELLASSKIEVLAKGSKLESIESIMPVQDINIHSQALLNVKDSNKLDDLEPEEAVALMSSFVFQQRNASELLLHRHFCQAKERYISDGKQVVSVQSMKVGFGVSCNLAENLKAEVLEVDHVNVVSESNKLESVALNLHIIYPSDSISFYGVS
ncbi:ALP1-like protein isoform X1, partial [Tanacetum coccineum]